MHRPPTPTASPAFRDQTRDSRLSIHTTVRLPCGSLHANATSLHHYEIEFRRSFLIEKRAFRLVSAAPMLVAARDSDEISRSDALFTCVILIEISSLDDN